jgi:hypothetical protein
MVKQWKKYYVFILWQAECLFRVKSSRLKQYICNDVLSDQVETQRTYFLTASFDNILLSTMTSSSIVLSLDT